VVLIKVAEMGQNFTGFIFAPVVDEPTRGKGHKDHPKEEDQSGGELETSRDEPGGVRLGVPGPADKVGAAVCMLVCLPISWP
jgi:hypothetical protein